MRKISIAVSCFAVFSVAVWAVEVALEDPTTGAPGELDCTKCHTTFPANSGNGAFSINTPPTYSPNELVTITVSLSDPGQARWGFQVTALTSANQPAGTMIVTEPLRTLKETFPTGRQYIKQTFLGSSPGTFNASPGWTFNWQAPATVVGPVTFYSSAVAGNDDGSPGGTDYVYVTTSTITDINVAPELSPVGDQSIIEGQTLSIRVAANDPNLTTPALSAVALPAGATFTDSANGAAGFVYLTDSTQVGTHQVVSYASDGSLGHSEVVVITVTPASCCVASTGNVDCDPADGVDIADLSALIDYLYISFSPLCCVPEANIDGSSDANIDIADLSALIDYLYISFSFPASCL